MDSARHQAMHQRHLEEAERHIAEGGLRISNQRALIAKLIASGHDPTQARELLASFLLSQAQHIAHRDTILSELR